MPVACFVRDKVIVDIGQFLIWLAQFLSNLFGTFTALL